MSHQSDGTFGRDEIHREGRVIEDHWLQEKSQRYQTEDILQ